MTTVAQALSEARLHIPVAEARLLLTHATGQTPAWLVAHDTDELSVSVMARFSDWVTRRAAGEPVAYLLGWREFYGHRFNVGPGILIPRPETELLVEQGLAAIAEVSKPRILDLGTGSGCIAISIALERSDAEVWALDFSTIALNTAAQNAASLGAVVNFRQSNWAAALAGPEFAQYFDLIVSNPPYIAPDDEHLHQGDLRFEPRTALAADDDGLADLRQIVRCAPGVLKRAGLLLCEHGYDQAAAMHDLLSVEGFEVVQFVDISGIVRVSGGRFAEAKRL